MTINYDLLKRLCETPGVPSLEDQVRAVTVEALRPLVDSVELDRLGNAVGLKRGKGGRRVMIAAHLDEIGFLVRHVDKDGYVKLQPLGGFDARTLFAQRVVVHSAKSGPLRGVLMPGAKPIHLMRGEQPKPPNVDEFFVDVGLTAQQAGEAIEVGDMVTLDRTVERVGGNVVGKAMDDRVGVFVMIEALRALRSHEVDVQAVATVQEEVDRKSVV